MTVVVRFSCLFDIDISVLFKLFNGLLGVIILTSASCVLTSSKYVSNATDGWIGGSQFDLTWKGYGSLFWP